MTDEVQFAKYCLLFYLGIFKEFSILMNGLIINIFQGRIASIDELIRKTDIMYIAFTKPYLDAKITDWEQSKAIAKTHFNQLMEAGLRFPFIFNPSNREKVF